MDKKAIFKKGAPKSEPIKIKGFKDAFIVRGLSARQRVAMFTELFDGGAIKDGKFFPAELIARCVVDAEGVRVFDDEDIEKLGTMSEDFLNPLFEVAQRLNGIGVDAVDEDAKN